MSKQKEQARMLLELRNQLVGKLHTQPFTIYTNETIKALLQAQPKSLEELGRVKGFPEDGKRLKRFGEAVVSIFTDEDVSDMKIIEEEDGSLTVTPVKKIAAF